MADFMAAILNDVRVYTIFWRSSQTLSSLIVKGLVNLPIKLNNAV